MSSLFTMGTTDITPGIAANWDAYEQVAREFAEADVSENAATPTAKAGDATLGTFNYGDVDLIHRRYFLNWNFSLNEAKADPSVTVLKIKDSDWTSFQRKAVGTETRPIYDQKRQGELDKIVFKELKVKQVSTNSTTPLAMTMSGINGNGYGIGTGLRSPFFINAESNAYAVNEVIHQLDERQMKLADLRYTHITREYLDKICPALPNSNMTIVPVKSEITDVIRQQKNEHIPKPNEIKLFADKTHYVLNNRLVERCKDTLIARRGNVSLPTTNMYEFEIALKRADGLAWEDSTIALQMSKETGLVGEQLLDYRINTSICIEADFFNLSSGKWNQK